jgi:hypothetical protein
MAEMPIVDLSQPSFPTDEMMPTRRADGHIDWNEPQPHGTYRCDQGWEAGGYQYGCMERGTTDIDGNFLCTDHALIHELAEIRAALQTTAVVDDDLPEIELMRQSVEATEEIVTALWDINYTLMSLRRRTWHWLRGWWQERSRASKRARLLPWAEYEREEHARNAVRNWLKNPTPAGAELATQRLSDYAHKSGNTTSDDQPGSDHAW